MNQPAVVQKPDDPNLYLFAVDEWFCYNMQNEPLGSGSMGTVYLGYRLKNGEKVAIKRVKDSFSNNYSIRERAKQEASLAFRHPNLVEMLGYCEYAPTYGPIFIISRFINGTKLDEHVKMYLDDREDRVYKICNCILSVLDALDYIHSRGVVHRDIKPTNIMVENGMNIRLMDLGIARMNQGNKFSAYGFVGTPQYAAPEQIIRDGNSSVQINASTDIYELGITCYELLAGTNPFDCESEIITLTKQLTEKLPASNAIPRKLMQVLWKATEKNQLKRYQTARQFKAAIEQAMQPKTNIYQLLTETIERYPIIIGGILGIILTIIIILIM